MLNTAEAPRLLEMPKPKTNVLSQEELIGENFSAILDKLNVKSRLGEIGKEVLGKNAEISEFERKLSGNKAIRVSNRESYLEVGVDDASPKYKFEHNPRDIFSLRYPNYHECSKVLYVLSKGSKDLNFIQSVAKAIQGDFTTKEAEIGWFSRTEHSEGMVGKVIGKTPVSHLSENGLISYHLNVDPGYKVHGLCYGLVLDGKANFVAKFLDQALKLATATKTPLRAS